MVRPFLPLNALRAFEASARHLSFTRAAIELNVTQAAVSHQVKALEQQLNVMLFKRLPRGLMLTREGEWLLPAVSRSFDSIALTMEHFREGAFREPLHIGVVGTFATGWLLPRLPGFVNSHPRIDLRLSTHNNRVDIAAEGLDYAVKFGSGAWQGLDATPLFEAPLSPLCTPELARTLSQPADVLAHTLLRSYRADEWPQWLREAGVDHPVFIRNSIMFDSSIGMIEAARQGAGIALAPPAMFTRALARGELVQPFSPGLSTGQYWLVKLQSRQDSPAMLVFSQWLLQQIAGQPGL